MSPFGDHTTLKDDKGVQLNGRDDLDKYWKDTILQTTAQYRLTWRRHAEAFPNHGALLRLPNDDDDDDDYDTFIFTSILHVLSAPCSDNDFACSNGLCIDGSLRCDNVGQCGDDSDEYGCAGERCTDV